MIAQELGLDRYLLDDVPARWCTSAVRALAEGRDVPEYGSEAWRQAEHRLQVAAAIRGAEAYRREVMFRPQALADELAASRQLLDEADARAFADLAGRIVNFDYVARIAASLAKSPTHDELLERRAA